MDSLTIGRILIDKVDRVERAGMTLRVRRDFDALYDAAAAFPDRPLSPLFSPRRFELHPDSAFWIEGRDGDGRVVHLQAAKLYDLRSIDLGTCLTQQLARAFDGADPIVDCPPLNGIRGRVCYHGEMRLSDDFVGRGVGTLLTHVGILLAEREWHTDWTVAFFEAPVMRRGFPVGAWYHNFAPVGRYWKDWIRPAELVGYIARQDLYTILELEARSSAP